MDGRRLRRRHAQTGDFYVHAASFVNRL